MYEFMNRTSSRIVRVPAASGLAQEFQILLPLKVKIRNSTTSFRVYTVFVLIQVLKWYAHIPQKQNALFSDKALSKVQPVCRFGVHRLRTQQDHNNWQIRYQVGQITVWHPVRLIWAGKMMELPFYGPKDGVACQHHYGDKIHISP